MSIRLFGLRVRIFLIWNLFEIGDFYVTVTSKDLGKSCFQQLLTFII